MTSQVAIANLALDAIGTRSSIASISEPSREARAISLHYAPALDAVLRSAHWNFARTQIVLALLNDATLSPPQKVPQPWLYEYAYPADCVLFRYIMPQYGNLPSQGPNVGSAIPFFLGAPVRFLISSDLDSNGNQIKVILTNQPQAIGIYTARVSNTELFDPDFVQAFSNYLAAKICIGVNGDKAMAKMALDLAQNTSIRAQRTNGNEGLTIIDQLPEWIRVRGYASDWAYPPGSMFEARPQNLTMIT